MVNAPVMMPSALSICRLRIRDCDDAVFPANCLHASIKKISQNKETKGGKVGEG